MPIIGLTLDATKSYQSKLDSARNTPEATIWKLGTLDSRIMGRIRDKATTMGVDPLKPDEVQQTVNLREMDFETVMYGLRGVENFTNGAGVSIPFSTSIRTHAGITYQIADPEFVRLIPLPVLEELGDEIRALNSLTAADAGNSGA